MDNSGVLERLARIPVNPPGNVKMSGRFDALPCIDGVRSLYDLPDDRMAFGFHDFAG